MRKSRLSFIYIWLNATPRALSFESCASNSVHYKRPWLFCFVLFFSFVKIGLAVSIYISIGLYEERHFFSSSFELWKWLFLLCFFFASGFPLS